MDYNGRQSAICRTKTLNGRSISFCTDILNYESIHVWIKKAFSDRKKNFLPRKAGIPGQKLGKLVYKLKLLLKHVSASATYQRGQIHKIQLENMASRPKKPKKAVSVSTFHKWQTKQDKEHKTLSWLRCDKHGNQVTSLWCQICKQFEHRIHGTKNFWRRCAKSLTFTC